MVKKAKPKYRYDHKTGKCEQLFISPKTVWVNTGWSNPDGSKHIIELPIDSPLIDLYRILNE